MLAVEVHCAFFALSNGHSCRAVAVSAVAAFFSSEQSVMVVLNIPVEAVAGVVSVEAVAGVVPVEAVAGVVPVEAVACRIPVEAVAGRIPVVSVVGQGVVGATVDFTSVPPVSQSYVVSVAAEVILATMIVAVASVRPPAVTSSVGDIYCRMVEIEVVAVRIAGINTKVPATCAPIQRTVEIAC